MLEFVEALLGGKESLMGKPYRGLFVCHVCSIAVRHNEIKIAPVKPSKRQTGPDLLSPSASSGIQINSKHERVCGADMGHDLPSTTFFVVCGWFNWKFAASRFTRLHFDCDFCNMQLSATCEMQHETNGIDLI